MKFSFLIPCLGLAIVTNAIAIEIDGSAFSTVDAPVPNFIQPQGERVVLIDPREHAFGAYDLHGKLIRWGIATTGADYCRDVQKSCRTQTGNFRIYSLGSANCISNSYPYPGGGAPMPFCMYFTPSQAIHGSNEVTYGNASHGCVRVHVDDAKWLRFKFVEPPSLANNFRGTKVVILPY